VDPLANVPGTLLALRARVSSQVEESLRRSADRGFLGSMPVPDQIDHALGFVFAAEATLGRPPGSVVDLGTGGGIPGMVLLSCWPASQVVLLDANERRTDFLLEESAHWERGGEVDVVRERAEELARDERFRQQFELVTSRSFGPPAVTAECGAPLLVVDGLLIVSEPPAAAADRWPTEGLARLGLTTSTQVRLESRFSYQVMQKSEPTADRYPRRVGIPAKRLLF
jgi:16S rRNA (guanine527-N7)-methyltransferase